MQRHQRDPISQHTIQEGVSSSTLAQPPLVGRGAEMDQLATRLSHAARRQGGALFLVGEAGIGKTSLVHHLTDQATRTARVLVGACDPLATPRPLGPLFDIAPNLPGPLEGLLESQTSERDRLFRALLTDLTRGASRTSQ